MLSHPKRAATSDAANGAAKKSKASSVPDSLLTLLPLHWKDDVAKWIDQDMPKWDIGGFVVGSMPHHAMLLGKSEGVLAGVPFATHVFEHVGCEIEWLRREGHLITKEEAAAKKPIAKVTGPTRNILMGERTALNILSRASGVATAAHAAMEIARAQGWHGKVAGTRKTTPGFGLIEKYALLVGGADTHRMDLSSMVMLKDNHIWSTGSITESVSRARTAAGFSTKIEVECTSEEDAIEAAQAGADVIMLDNYNGEQLKAVSGRIKKKWPHIIIEVRTSWPPLLLPSARVISSRSSICGDGHRHLRAQASGGITIETMPQFFSPSVDIISQGALTNGYGTLDFSLKVPKPDTFASRSRIK